MRLFVRCEDLKVLTLWLNEGTTVLNAKTSIYESKRTKININEMRLIVGDHELSNDFLLYGNIHACIKYYQPDIYHLNYILSVSPIKGSSLESNPESLTINLSKECEITFVDMNNILPTDIVYLRTDRDELLESQCIYNKELSTLHCYPISKLYHNRSYTVHINSKHITYNGVYNCKDYEWSFNINTLPSIRLSVTHTPLTSPTAPDTLDSKPTSKSASNAKKQSLITLHRNLFSLYTELIKALAQRFSVPEYTITTINTSYMSITTDQDVARLQELDTLTFTTDPILPLPYTDRNSSLTTGATGAGGAQTAAGISGGSSSRSGQTAAVAGDAWQQYVADNWVNDASGYIAISGKMSPQDEHELLLQVIEAFSVKEDNYDGIGNGVLTDAYTVKVEEARAMRVVQEVPDSYSMATTAAAVTADVSVPMVIAVDRPDTHHTLPSSSPPAEQLIDGMIIAESVTETVPLFSPLAAEPMAIAEPPSLLTAAVPSSTLPPANNTAADSSFRSNFTIPLSERASLWAYPGWRLVLCVSTIRITITHFIHM